MAKTAVKRLVIPQHARQGGPLTGATWGSGADAVRVGLVDRCTEQDVFMPTTGAAPHLSLVLLLEGQGHFQMGSGGTPCEFLAGHCFLSCGWEPFDGEDFIPAHARFRAVLLHYPLALRAVLGDTAPLPRAGCEVHPHPRAKAWLARLPLPAGLGDWALALMQRGLPTEALDGLDLQCQALRALHAVASTLAMAGDLGEAPRDGDAAALTGRERRQLLAARRHIDAHLDQPLNVAGIAAAAGMNETALKQGFRGLFGRGVYEQVLHSRCEAAGQLLRGGALPVQEVARRCGFAHASHLAQHFRQQFGTTPLRYRKQQR